MSRLADDEGLNEENSNENGSHGNESRGEIPPPTYQELTPLDPSYAVYEQLQEAHNEYEDIEQQQPEEYNQSLGCEAIQGDIQHLMEELSDEEDMEDNIFGGASRLGARISFTADMTSTPNKDEER